MNQPMKNNEKPFVQDPYTLKNGQAKTASGPDESLKTKSRRSNEQVIIIVS